MNPRVGECPLEQMIATSLTEAGITFLTDYEGGVPENLDFYLPEFQVHIEVKGGHSPRISDQTSRSSNVIVAQGRKAVRFLSALIASKPNSAF